MVAVSTVAVGVVLEYLDFAVDVVAAFDCYRKVIVAAFDSYTLDFLMDSAVMIEEIAVAAVP